MSRWPKLQSRPLLIWIAILISLTSARIASAATYYIAPDGNDIADGKSPDHPWQTLVRASAQSLKGGDQLLLRRNGVWHETFTMASDGDPAMPIIISAYGQGDRPRIDGADPIDPSKFTATDSPGVFHGPRR